MCNYETPCFAAIPLHFGGRVDVGRRRAQKRRCTPQEDGCTQQRNTLQEYTHAIYKNDAREAPSPPLIPYTVTPRAPQPGKIVDCRFAPLQSPSSPAGRKAVAPPSSPRAPVRSRGPRKHPPNLILIQMARVSPHTMTVPRLRGADHIRGLVLFRTWHA